MATEIGKQMLAFQEELSKEYRYQPIQYNLFLGDVRQKYADNLPAWCDVNGSEKPLYSINNGILIANGYDRIVIGDYGAFIEIDPGRMKMDHIIIKPGEEYRILDAHYADHVKYHWYTCRRDQEVKLYYQIKAVTYADYLPGMWYVSPYHVKEKEGE